MEKKIIGANTFIKVAEIAKVPAKIDTGADSSAIWASDIKMSKGGVLSFKLFGPSSPFYTGEIIKTTNYEVVVTRSSHGDKKIFYRTTLPIVIKGHKIRTLFTLSSRGNNKFPILIGKRTIRGKFIVDVEKVAIINDKAQATQSKNEELRQNPYKFHQKYFKNDERSQK